MADLYFSGQGKVLVAERNGSGNPLAFRHLGNCSAVALSFETDKFEHKESQSGQRQLDQIILREKRANFSVTMENFTAKNLALAFYGDEATIAASTVTGEVLPTLAVGDFARLAHQDVSSVVVKDSAGSPATLVANTDYRVASAKHGTIEILGLASYTQPFKADYSYAQVANVRGLTAALPERWFRIELLNTADNNRAVLVEVYRVLLDPIAQADLLSDELLQMALTGNALYDSVRADDTQLGPFCHWTLMD